MGYRPSDENATDISEQELSQGSLARREVNRHVVRDSIGTVVFVGAYALLVLWLMSWAHGFATVLFWVGAVFVGLRALQVVIVVVSGSILFVARRFGWRPEGPDPNTFVASLVIFLEFVACASAFYYLYLHL